MKNLKRLAVAFVLLAGIGVTMASCSDDYYYEEPNVSPPIEVSPEQPPIVNPE
ncbi:hypothetical protein [uncultured Draconibacterium sp.]|uniref:hypothetical protein n=1 Tax=uncultured Draconibacterium sp. TaxID=1573823 RepID=UPI0032613EEB